MGSRVATPFSRHPVGRFPIAVCLLFSEVKTGVYPAFYVGLRRVTPDAGCDRLPARITTTIKRFEYINA